MREGDRGLRENVYFNKNDNGSYFSPTISFLLHSEQKSSLCGTEKNTFPLSSGLKMDLIHKQED